MKQINFNSQSEYQSNLIIEDIGNCSIEAWNELEYLYYIIIKTIRGKSYIAEWGPIIEDEENFIDGYKSSFKIMEFNDKRINSELWSFLNDRSKKIVNARELEVNEALDAFKDLKLYMEGLYDKN